VMDGAIEPPWTGLRRVLQAHTAPPTPRKPRAGCCFGFGFGFRLCGCRAQPGQPSLPDLHIWLPNPAVDLPECAIALPE
ncbi:hypothetical protein, partial [Stenotrophomonas lactitubi]